MRFVSAPLGTAALEGLDEIYATLTRNAFSSVDAITLGCIALYERKNNLYCMNKTRVL